MTVSRYARSIPDYVKHGSQYEQGFNFTQNNYLSASLNILLSLGISVDHV